MLYEVITVHAPRIEEVVESAEILTEEGERREVGVDRNNFV